MAEITAPIIAITLVLLSVFVPIAFIPGISGELFRQFAVTVAVSMLLSAVNALTLSPALCGVLLKPHHGPKRGIIGWLMRSIDWVRDQYGAVVARLVRFSAIGIAMVLVAGAGTFGLARVTPTGFVPEDDQGAIFVVVQLPGGASVGRTSEVMRQAEAIVKEDPAVAEYTSIIGLNFIDNYSQPNAGFMVVTFKPFEERKSADLGAREVIARLRTKFRQIQTGTVVPLAPPPIVGLGTGGGFTYVLEDLRGGDPKELAQVVRGLTVAANQDPRLRGVFSTFSATNPSIYLDIDRDKVQILGVPLKDVFQALQASLGGYFINNLNLFWPDLAGAGAGRGRRQVAHRRHLPHQRAKRRRKDDPVAEPRGDARCRRAAGLDPIQQPAGRDRSGRSCAGHIVGSGTPGIRSDSGEDASTRIRGRVDGHCFSGEAR